jgi:hypothetical protein
VGYRYPRFPSVRGRLGDGDRWLQSGRGDRSQRGGGAGNGGVGALAGGGGGLGSWGNSGLGTRLLRAGWIVVEDITTGERYSEGGFGGEIVRGGSLEGGGEGFQEDCS